MWLTFWRNVLPPSSGYETTWHNTPEDNNSDTYVKKCFQTGKQRHLYSTVTFFPAFSHIFCVMFHPLEQTLETMMPLMLYLCCEFVTVHLVKWKTVIMKAVLHCYNKTDVKLGCKVCGCVAILGCTVPGFLFQSFSTTLIKQTVCCVPLCSNRRLSFKCNCSDRWESTATFFLNTHRSEYSWRRMKWLPDILFQDSICSSISY
jgi:hypothetical protein